MEDFVFDPKVENKEQCLGALVEAEENVANQVILQELQFDSCYVPIESDRNIFCPNCQNEDWGNVASYDDDCYIKCACSAGLIPLHTPQEIETLLYMEAKLHNSKDKVSEEKLKTIEEDVATGALLGKYEHLRTPRILGELIQSENPDEKTKPIEEDCEPWKLEEKGSYNPNLRGCFKRLSPDNEEIPENIREQFEDDVFIVYKMGIVKVKEYGRIYAINDGIFTRVHQKFHVRYTGDWKDPLKLLKAVKNFEGQIRMVLKNDQEQLNLLDKMLEICEESKNAGGRFGKTKMSFVLARALDVPLCTGNEAYLASDGGENGYYGICEACGEEVYGFMSAD